MLTPASRWKLAAGLLVIVAAAIALATVRDYGATWDEDHSMRQGELVLEWYASGFHDRRVIDEGLFWLYGGFFNVLAQLVHRAGVPLYEASHALTLVFGLTGLALAYLVGAALSSPLGGFLSALFLWLTPAYYGHSFNNPKDLPFAVMSLACFGAILACWRHLPAPPRRIWLPVGVIIGLTLAVRVAGIVALAYLALSWMIWLALRPAARRKDALQLALSGAKIVATAWLAMCLFWPWAQTAPLLAPWQTLHASLNFTDWVATVRFGGSDILSSELPASYVPVWLAISLPEFYALALLLAIVPLRRVAERRPLPDADRARAVFVPLLALSAAVPVVSAVLFRPILYDGIRHLLFVLPPLAILAGIAVARFYDGVQSTAARAAAALALAASLGITALDMWHLHPYQTVYFNRSVAGGLKGAYGRFETDYWGQSYKEAAEWLVANYRPGGALPTGVANCSNPFLSAYYLEKTPERRARFKTVELNQAPDIVLATTRWGCQDRIAGRVLHVVQRMNTPLCYVIEVDRARYRPPGIGL